MSTLVPTVSIKSFLSLLSFSVSVLSLTLSHGCVHYVCPSYMTKSVVVVKVNIESTHNVIVNTKYKQ